MDSWDSLLPKARYYYVLVIPDLKNWLDKYSYGSITPFSLVETTLSGSHSKITGSWLDQNNRSKIQMSFRCMKGLMRFNSLRTPKGWWGAVLTLDMSIRNNKLLLQAINFFKNSQHHFWALLFMGQWQKKKTNEINLPAKEFLIVILCISKMSFC